MKGQVHIRNIEAADLARAWARQTGKTISDVVLEALRQYRPGEGRSAGPTRVADWRRLLRENREAAVVEPETTLDALYDPDTGLPM